MIGQQSCRCCGKGKLEKNILTSAEIIEKETRSTLYLNSGCRCDTHNKAVGGHKNSAHKYNKAIDVYTPDCSMEDVYWAAMDIPWLNHGEVGVYFTDSEAGWFIHLADTGYKNRFAYYYGERIDFDEALAIMETESLKYS